MYSYMNTKLFVENETCSFNKIIVATHNNSQRRQNLCKRIWLAMSCMFVIPAHKVCLLFSHWLRLSVLSCHMISRGLCGYIRRVQKESSTLSFSLCLERSRPSLSQVGEVFWCLQAVTDARNETFFVDATTDIWLVIHY